MSRSCLVKNRLLMSILIISLLVIFNLVKIYSRKTNLATFFYSSKKLVPEMKIFKFRSFFFQNSVIARYKVKSTQCSLKATNPFALYTCMKIL